MPTRWRTSGWSGPTSNGRDVPGKLGMINDGDLDYGGQGDGMPDYADGFDWFSGPDSDQLSLTSPPARPPAPCRRPAPARDSGRQEAGRP